MELYLSELCVASDRDQFYKGVYAQKQEFISLAYCNTEARLHTEAQGILLGHESVCLLVLLSDCLHPHGPDGCPWLNLLLNVLTPPKTLAPHIAPGKFLGIGSG